MYPLSPLPYDPDALQPVIGAETMQTHHGKHHAKYVDVVNELTGEASGARPLEDLIAEAHERGDRKLFNNAAQTWNHGFFWESMAPFATSPGASLRDAIDSRFGNLDALRNLFVGEGAAHFGSGWVWLIVSNGELEVVSTHDAEQPWLGAAEAAPLLVCDLWEHAYYLDYKNERDQFLGAWFDRLANWDFAAEQRTAALRGEPAYRYPLAAKVGGHAAARHGEPRRPTP